MTKLSKVSFFLFVSTYNYIWFRIIVFKYFYTSIGNMGLLYAAILAVCVLLFFIFLPKKLMNYDYEAAFQKSYFKFFYMIFLFLEAILSISFCCYLISSIFIPNSKYWIILLGVVLAITVISSSTTRDVIELSTLFNIVGYLILLTSFLFLPQMDFSILLPFKNVKWLTILFYFMFIIGDNFSLIINKKDISFNRINFILGIATAILLFGIEYTILICSAGTEFFNGLNWVGFVCFSIEPVSKYIGNFDFAYIFYILVSCIFKYAHNVSLVRNSMTLSSKGVGAVIFIMLLVLGLISFYFIPMGDKLLLIISIFVLGSFSILFWFIKECYFVRKIKE